MDNIKDNSIVICNNNCKVEILKNINKMINIKFMDINEFIKNYLFDYDYNTILYIMNKYGVDYEVALEYINNLYYIEDTLYNNKLDFLVKLKKELIENKLLIFNYKFKNYIKDKNIVVYKYNLNKFEEYLLSKIDNVSYIKESINNYTPSIYEFDTMEEEVEFIAYSISNLINNGVDINNIKLVNVGNDYINVINKIFGFYNLKINKFNNIPIISNIVGSTFYNNIDSGINEAINSISNYKETNTYNKIIDICNKYILVSDINDLKKLITYDLKNTYIENNIYTNMIEVVDYKNYEFNNCYVFMLSANQGILPKIYKDEDFISDNIKPSYLDTTVEKNNKERIYLIDKIKSINNLVITYKLKAYFNTFYKSSIIDELDVNVKKGSIDITNSYSKLSDKIKFAKNLDLLIKFGSTNNNLITYNSNYDIPYNTYSNDFTGIDKDKVNRYINSLKNFNLSYSSMDNYNRCAFRFYIDKILCLKKDSDNFGIVLGNLYHNILEQALTKDIDIRSCVDKFIEKENLELTNSNKFFIERTINNLEYLISVIKKQNSYSKLNNIETEKFIKVPIKDNINFVGFIDKILTNDNKSIGAIIDYKTYVKKPSLKYIESGIGLQLPTYMYLAKQEFKNIRFAGFYLQNITLDNKSLEEKEKSLKLIGYTNSDKDVLENFDYNYSDSNVIDGIKVNKDGSFSSNSLKKMVDDNMINDIINTTKEQIDLLVNNIKDSKYDINPKYDNGNIGCEFCMYKDLCYMNENNYKYIKSNLEVGEV